MSWFASTDGETGVSLAQWESAVAHDAYPRGGGYSVSLAGPPRYRLYRSMAEENETRVPGCLITAAFDVDGSERQRSFTDAVIAAQPREGGHREAAEAGDQDKGHEIFPSTPGARLTHGGRYRLHRSLSLPCRDRGARRRAAPRLASRHLAGSGSSRQTLR